MKKLFLSFRTFIFILYLLIKYLFTMSKLFIFIKISFFCQKFRNTIYINDFIHEIYLQLLFFRNINVDINEIFIEFKFV